MLIADFVMVIGPFGYLRSLDIHFNNWNDSHDPLLGHIPFQCIVGLRDLSLDGLDLTLPSLSAALSRVPESLETIRLVLDSRNRADIEEAEWRLFDNALSNARLRHLHKVELSIHTGMKQRGRVCVRLKQDKLQEWFPLLSIRNPQILAFKIECPKGTVLPDDIISRPEWYYGGGD